MDYLKWLDPVRALQFWGIIVINLLCLTLVIKVFKLLLYVAFQEVKMIVLFVLLVPLLFMLNILLFMDIYERIYLKYIGSAVQRFALRLFKRY